MTPKAETTNPPRPSAAPTPRSLQVGPDQADSDAGNGAAVRSPWLVAGRKLTHNRQAMAALVVFLVILGSSVGAPLYARDVAHDNPFANNINGTTIADGKRVALLQQGGGALKLGETPIGPTWDIHHYFLGSDEYGRDVAARVLYGGRTSLLIGTGSAVLCCLLATLLAVVAGFYGGVADTLLARTMDVIWALPVYLMAICIATVLLTTPHPPSLGPIALTAGSLWLPTMIIAVIYVPYVFRSIRGHVLSLRRQDFIEAAVALGASDCRLMFSDVLPNVVPVVVVFLPLMIATTILTESALSFLSIGVQAPNASWGTIINDGQGLVYTRPWVAIAPGLMIVLTVLSLNTLGDGVRDALDPRATLRTGR